MVIARDGFFYLTLARMIDFFILLTMKYRIYVDKRLPEVPEYAEMGCDMMTSFLHNNDVT